MTAFSIRFSSSGVAAVPRGSANRPVLRVAALCATALAVVVAGVPGVQERLGEPTQPAATDDFASLPLVEKSAVSQALGRDDRAYRAAAGNNGLRLENRRHRLAARFRPGGVEVRAGDERLHLEVRGWGSGDALRPVADAVPRAHANRVSYRRGALTEWYVNGPLGLQQGFTLASPPTTVRHGPLTLALSLSGTLVPRLVSRREVAFADSTLGYRGLTAFDARGRELRAWLELDGRTLLLRVRDRGAHYPLTIDPFVQQAKLTASDGTTSDDLGASVAVSESTIVVGAPDTADSVGKAYVFERPAAGWATATQTATLTASDRFTDAHFGCSVAISGSTIAVGAGGHHVGTSYGQGAVYVFERPAGGWANATETAKLTASDGASGDRLGGIAHVDGGAVALSGSTIFAGAPDDDIGTNADQGSVYVFERPAGGWATGTETAKLTVSGGAAEERLGSAVAVSDATVAVGAPRWATSVSPGAVYVFERPAGGWANATQTAKLTASDGMEEDILGRSVAVSASTIVAGNPYHSRGEEGPTGAAYVFTRPASGWANATETAKLTASDAADNELGTSVALSGGTLVAGAPNDGVDGSLFAGSLYVFERPATGWASMTETEKLTASDAGIGDSLGASAALAGGTLVAGAPSDDGRRGSAYVFGVGGSPEPSSPPVADFDGDGDTDLSVWRPGNGTWYAFGGLTQQWGVSDDVPVPGQYDADPATDVAVWRPANGTWYVHGGASQQWGVSSDVPVPGDYDGDGDTEFVVWRPADGTWYVHGGVTQQWGISSDIPVPGQYDADAATDIAVWRPSTGTWYVHGGLTEQWGISTDIPVPGQYDADAATDVAVWRPSSGTWYVQGGATLQWGVSTDVPVPGDYDANGDTEFAVWRPSTGTWYVHGGAAQQWGISSDKPLPVPPAIARLLYP